LAEQRGSEPSVPGLFAFWHSVIFRVFGMKLYGSYIDDKMKLC
jgi:hypothetical protein